MSDQPMLPGLDDQTLHIVASNLTVAHYVEQQQAHRATKGQTASKEQIITTFDQFVRLLQERQGSTEAGH